MKKGEESEKYNGNYLAPCTPPTPDHVGAFENENVLTAHGLTWLRNADGIAGG